MLRFLLLPVIFVATATSASAEGPDNVSGWKTFSNRAGWSIKHPRNQRPFSCRSCPDTTDPDVYVSFFARSSDNGVMVEHLIDKPARKTIDQWMDELIYTANLNSILEKEWITVSNLRALKVRYRNVPTSVEMEVVYVVRGNDTFSITASDIRNASFYGMYRQMLSTFQFHKMFRKFRGHEVLRTLY